MSSRHGKLWTEHGRISNPRALHKPDEQTPEEQDKERAALSRVAAPFPVPVQTHPEDCPCDLCEDLRRRSLRVLGIPGLTPKNEWDDDITERRSRRLSKPAPLVEQSRQREREYGDPS